MDKRASHASDKDLLEYYHSPLAGQGHCYQLARHSRQLSTISTSSSEYSCLSDSRDATSSDASSQVTRRSSIPSEGSADRRRVAIVEVDAPAEEEAITASQTSYDPSNTLRSRRGLQSSLSGLAIVAPPDSSHKPFVLLTPPSTAPLTATLSDRHTPQEPASIFSHHQRSTSEILPRKKTRSRDIGIVGTAQLTSFGAKQSTKPDKSLPNMYTPDNNNNTTLHPPIFQQPKSSTPSPEPFQVPSPPVAPAPIRGLKIMKREKSKELLSVHPSPAKNSVSSLSPQLTPEIGKEKDSNVPVALPFPAGLNNATDAGTVVGGIRLVKQRKAPVPNDIDASSFTSLPTLVLPTTDSTLSYVNYQPGVHSTAGPLPPPPRLPGFEGLTATPTSPPPPRPPRLNSPLPPRDVARSKDIEAVKQALQLPPSVSAALASKTLTKSGESLTKNTMPESRGSNSSHALAPAVASSTSISTTSRPSLSDMSALSRSVSENITSIHRREGAFPPATSDAGSLDGGKHPEEDATSKQIPLASSATNDISTATGQVKEDEEEVPQVRIISEPLPPPSPILEEPIALTPTKGGDDVDSLRPRHRRERGQVVVTSDNENDSNENWVAISRTSSPSSHHDRSTSLDNNGTDRESLKTPSEAPSPPPKSFKNSLTTGLKRFSSRSLPRTPSISSGGSRRSSIMSKRFSAGSASLAPFSVTTPISTTASPGGSANGSSNGSAFGSGLDVSSTRAERTPSPLPQAIPKRAATVLGHALPNAYGHGNVTGYSASVNDHGIMKSTVKKRQKTVVQWPSAMFCNEIHATNGRKKLSSGEKCAIYAQKINELYMYDCGLTEWVVETRFRGPNSNTGAGGTSKKFLDARSPANVLFTPQPRQTSRSSIISDATFPTRPDATTATDLLSSSHDDDGAYHEDVPPLPYPSLATAQRAAASNVVSIASPSTSNAALMTSPASLRSSGSNTTLPSVGGGSTNTHPHPHLTHTPVSTLTPLAGPSTPVNLTTIPLSPISPSVKHPAVTSLSSSPSAGGFFATLGRKASLSSAKRPNLGLGLSNLISSSSPSAGFSPLTSSHRLLTKSISGSNSGGTNLTTSTIPRSPITGGLQMNTASPPSVVPGGPRALMNNNRVQRSKTYIPSTSSPFNGFGGGLGGRSGVGAGGMGGGSGGGGNQYGGNIERRPSLWELQLNSTNAISGGMAAVAPVISNTMPGSNTPMPYSYNFSSQPHPYANPFATAGYATDSSQLTHLHHSQPYTPTTPQHNQPEPQQQTIYDPQSDSEFIRQVDKLADLLPHADRNILAGYLTRAGQDVLAIGQYLEDEKNGTLKAC